MKNRKEQLIDYIRQNPELSGNKIYEYSRKNGFGIRKQEFYNLYRKQKSISKPSKEKQLKSIPVKYRTQQQQKQITKIEKKEYKEKKKKPKEYIESKVDVKLYTGVRYPKKEGSYGIMEFIYNDESKWIKYTSKQDLISQIQIILDSYEIPIAEYILIFHGFGKYKEYTEQEYINLLNFAL